MEEKRWKIGLQLREVKSQVLYNNTDETSDIMLHKRSQT